MPTGALDDVQLHRVDNLAALDACRRWAGERRETPLFADTESAGLNPHKDRHRLTQLGDKRHGWAFPPAWFGAANEILMCYPGAIGFHNSPYDARVLEVSDGVAIPWHKTEDTLLLGHITDSLRLAGLKARAGQDVDDRAIRAERDMKEGMKARHWTWDTVPDSWRPYWMYGALDPVLAAWLWDTPAFRLSRGSYAQAYDTERAAARICANMMMAGMMTDVPFITERIAEIRAYLGKAENWLRAEFGITNVRSGAQVVAAMEAAGIPTLVYTEKGNPQLDKEALKFYRTAFPQHQHLIDAIGWCRKGESLVGSYLEKFLYLRGSDDIMHYNIHSCRARTTRMSITDPPMQTFDRDVPAVRGSFIPRPPDDEFPEGYVFITIDADQIEARLAAHFSADPRMIEDFRYADEHQLKFFIEMASKIYTERITKKDPRYTWTKNATYAQIYGSGLDKAAATAGVPVETMRPAYMALQTLYPNVKILMNRLIRQAEGKRPKVQTIDGRWLYTNRGKEYALLNTLIQGSAATIMKWGLINLDAAGLGPYLRLVAHDEAMLEVPKRYAADVLRLAENILTDRTSYRVPITWSGAILEERWVKA
jgi:DNA polymerase I-like protein with 3'-5' exonuclease and polymerase domains